MARKRSKYRCSDCEHWRPGEWWKCGPTGMVADGYCNVTGNPRLNCQYACRGDFKYEEPSGIIICGNAKGEIKSNIPPHRIREKTKEWLDSL